ncbi:nuclear transport factor 2 family protein [uncultured Photobacterium sp.]|uniref:nuclear transport factor 2 family protein n=1 Tax=uncultured Photobacterium sp. TaxID=173973 RepID=UPI0026300C4F|nr:nuclear transport factor 2 family protein [uncultured Photobacterium sp.]
MNILIEQEIALHQHDIRSNKVKAERFLHPDFREVGISGMCFDYNSIMAMMGEEEPSSLRIHSQDFECVELEPTVILLLYKSAFIDDSGDYNHFAKRSSIWVLNGQQWQMKYHQGTVCEPFEIKTE